MLSRRQKLRELLTECEWTPRELAKELGRRIGEVIDDLEHVQRSAGKAWRVRPAECQRCGFVFRDRTRPSTPSRCPSCKSEKVSGPWLWVDDG